MKTAVCVIVKNEARDIAEWLAFHGLLGFDALIVFDNQSTDRTAAIVRSAARTMDVRLVPWDRSDPKTQTDAYEETCRTFRHEFDWIAFIDADEFLVLHEDPDVASFISRYEGAQGIGVNWAIFGANGHVDIHTDLLTRSFTRRSPASFFQNRHVKSIVRPGQVIACPNPHFFELDGTYYDGLVEPMQWMRDVAGSSIPGGVTARPADYTLCQLNHYFTRSEAHWAAKVARGYPSDIAVRRAEEFHLYNRNEVEDRTLVAMADRVARRMAEFGEA